MAASILRELTDQVPDGASRARDQDSLTRLRLPHVKQPKVCRQAIATEHADVVHRVQAIVALFVNGETFGLLDGEALPAVAGDHRANSNIGVIGGDNARDRAASHHHVRHGGSGVRC